MLSKLLRIGVMLVALCVMLLVMFSGGFRLQRKIERISPDHNAIVSKDEKPSNHQDYEKLESLYLQEQLPGGEMELQIDFKENIILYSEALYESSIKGTFTENEKKDLLLLLEKYQFLEWKTGRYYWDLNYRPVMDDVTSYAINIDANYVKRMEFLSLNKYEYYMGMGADELWYRTKYNSRISYQPNEELKYNPLTYESFGVPDGYNELLDCLWDFVFDHLDIADRRSELDQRGKDYMLKRCPYMGWEELGTPDYDKIWYFSYNEFFGGQKSGPGASLVYSHTERNPQDTDYMEYIIWTPIITMVKSINFVDEEGNIQKYRNRDSALETCWSDYAGGRSYNSSLSEEGKQKLIEILKKYDVASWKESENNSDQMITDSIEEGQFFNLIPGEAYNGISKLEYEIRSSYESYIYIYDTDGKRMRLRLNKTAIPENFNGFRKELWDFAINYMSKEEYFVDADWRNQLDKWGKDYLESLQNEEKID